MSARSTDGLPFSVPLTLLLATSVETNVGEDCDEMSCSFTDENTGTTTTALINFRTDGNKIADDQGNTWLHLGARTGNDRMINGFIKKGGKGLDIDIRNAKDQTPFMIAVSHGWQNTAEIILKHGADINACIRVVSPDCVVGITALRMAAEKDDIPMVQFLLSNEASITEDAHGATPLDYLWSKASIGVVRALIEGGCSPHHVLKINEYNALHMASQNPDLNIFRMLLTEYRVNPNQKDSKGKYPIDFVTNLDLVKLLLNNKAEVANGTLVFAIENCQWEKLIILLKHAIISQAPATTQEEPFAFFVRKIDILRHAYEEVEPKYVLEITTLFLGRGEKITPEMHQNFINYFYVHRAYQDLSEFQQLKKLVNDNSPSSVEPPQTTIRLLEDEYFTNSLDDRRRLKPKCVIS